MDGSVGFDARERQAERQHLLQRLANTCSKAHDCVARFTAKRGSGNASR